jgi:hypothetical protein
MLLPFATTFTGHPKKHKIHTTPSLACLFFISTTRKKEKKLEKQQKICKKKKKLL